MQRKIFGSLLLVISLVISSCSTRHFEFNTGSFSLTIDKQGEITEMTDTKTGENYLAVSQSTPLMQIRKSGNYLTPTSFESINEEELFLLTFTESIQATISIDQVLSSESDQPSGYIKLSLVEISQSDSIELIVWGPYPTQINQTIGETVGVVRDSAYAIGIQALNLKTLGGYPSHESDIDQSYDIFETNSLIDVADSIKVFYRGQTAKKQPFGSVIQAYCRNRNEERIIPNWNHDFYVAPAFDDGGITGSSIALFGCNPSQVLPTIGMIEIKEELPHPELDGVWGKTNKKASAAYIITSFGVNNFEDVLEMTQKAGLNYLYHEGPFENWGHFDLRKDQFPENWETLELMVDRAAEEEIRLGVHTLSNFITTNDPYVTPVPDPRLAKVGESTLTKSIGPADEEIFIESPTFFNQMKNNTLHAVVIGDEVIRYATVSESEPWKLQDCVRGAFGTQASSHEANDQIAKLMDHGYRTFLTDNNLSIEMSTQLAKFFNFTGCRQISFDGLEGNWSTGMGQYGRQRFTQNWYDLLDPVLQGEVITDASNPGHFFWHMFTRMNWGEPWYAGFRESQTQYRLLNQLYFQRNFIPGMLGWFKMTPQTSIEDIEWMLARSAAFDAGYGMVTHPSIVAMNGFGEKLLNTIKIWEEARMAGAFPEDLKKEMQNIRNEYHLDMNGPYNWTLYKFTIWRAEYQNVELQPGQQNVLNLDLENSNPDQPLQFILTALGKGTAGPFTIILDGSREISLPMVIEENQHLKYTGGSYVSRFDSNWNLLDRVRVIQDEITLSQGNHQFSFESVFSGAEDQGIKLELKTASPGRNIIKPSNQ